MKRSEQEKLDAIQKLREWVKPGDTVSTILRHVSKSGMSRSISLVICRDGQPFDITYFAARATDGRVDQNNGGMKAGGCGMDMGFALVYGLAYTLFRDEFYCTGTNGFGVRDDSKTF